MSSSEGGSSLHDKKKKKGKRHNPYATAGPLADDSFGASDSADMSRSRTPDSFAASGHILPMDVADVADLAASGHDMTVPTLAGGATAYNPVAAGHARPRSMSGSSHGYGGSGSMTPGDGGFAAGLEFDFSGMPLVNIASRTPQHTAQLAPGGHISPDPLSDGPPAVGGVTPPPRPLPSATAVPPLPVAPTPPLAAFANNIPGMSLPAGVPPTGHPMLARVAPPAGPMGPKVSAGRGGREKAFPMLPFTPEELNERANTALASGTSARTTCPPGFAFSVYNSDSTLHYQIPSELVLVTRGAVRVAEHYQKFGPQTRYRFQLCPGNPAARPSGEPPCDKAADCVHIHALELPTPQVVHINHWSGRDMKTFEDEGAPQPTVPQDLECLPAGYTLYVFRPNAAPNSPAEVQQAIPSHLVLKTVGAETALRAQQGVPPPQRGRGDSTGPRCKHCAHFQFKRLCNLGPACHFVHAKVPCADRDAPAAVAAGPRFAPQPHPAMAGLPQGLTGAVPLHGMPVAGMFPYAGSTPPMGPMGFGPMFSMPHGLSGGVPTFSALGPPANAPPTAGPRGMTPMGPGAASNSPHMMTMQQHALMHHYGYALPPAAPAPGGIPGYGYPH